MSSEGIGMSAVAHASENVRVSARQVLLVEDNQLNQMVAEGMLRLLGYECRSVNDGLQAVAELRTTFYPIVLMDVQMPELDGLEATRRLRQREGAEGGHIPVIAMTAHAMMGDRERCLAAGMDGYITKPIRIESLLAIIADSLPC